ncbi:helix-turn-helix domain-containing protein [Streptomyces sp. NPDC046925]|uniref:TetR/AcrR family transcriptional regulator n=1 Tax=Streptomyces sp. NPDC046925 TaxID=3155375 RepID=UPI00340D0D36
MNGDSKRPMPPRRRDARRNWELLVEAARAEFAEQGLEAPLDVIARRAGVGNATLYRNFPTRAALINAVFHDLLTGTMTAGEQARTVPDAWAALNDYLQAVFVTLAADRGTNDLMTTNLEGIDALQAVHAHNRETMDILLSRGREQGAVRADVTTEDVLFALAALGRAVPALMAATAVTGASAATPAAGASAPDAWRRPLALFLDGLRASPGVPELPGSALTADRLGDVLTELGPHRASRNVSG